MPFRSLACSLSIGGLVFLALVAQATLTVGSDNAASCHQWPETHHADVEGIEMLQMRSLKVDKASEKQAPGSPTSIDDANLQDERISHDTRTAKGDIAEPSPDCFAVCETMKGTTGLLQQSLRNAAAKDAGLSDVHMSEQQIVAELQLTRMRAATLEALLANAKGRASEGQSQESQVEAHQSSQPASTLDSLLVTARTNATDERPKAVVPGAKPPPGPTTAQRVAKLVTLFLILVMTTVYGLRAVTHYEAERDEFDQPWYHHNLTLTKVLIALGTNWLVFGVFMFTEIMFFDTGRHLTTIEAVYLNSQIITTIGYGELTPTTQLGVLFMMLYAIVAAFLFGMKAQHLIVWYMEISGDAHRANKPSPASTVAPIMACWIFGTVFYAYYPGEGKTICECMYMSVITFLTIGFGDFAPETPVGQAIGSVWMVVGVIFTGKAIMDVTWMLYHHRRNLRSQTAAAKAFSEMDKSQKGFIDKAQFLGFELVQEGTEQSTIDRILAKFDEFDLEHDGTLNFKEFTAYVDSIEDLEVQVTN